MADIVRIERVVDASAYCASLVTGVRVAYGIGSSGIVFPAGVVIPPVPDTDEPLEPFTHTSGMPAAPGLRWHSATVLRIEWRIPMRLWLDGNLHSEARMQAAPFYGRYLTTFSQNMTLGGHANSAMIASWGVGGDDDNVWLDMILSVWEEVNLDNQPGPAWG